MKFLLTILTVLVFSSVLPAQKVYEFNTTCQQAYKEISQLKITNGLALIEKAKQQNPNNLIPIYLESYIDVLELFFNEDAAEYKKRKNRIDDRINELKKGPTSSPFYKFCLCNIYLHKAVISIRYGENMSAAWDAKKAYSLIKDNRKTFSTFAPNEMLYGSLQAITGTIPKGYKWLAAILGMKGSVTEGMQTLTKFVTSSDPWAKLFNPEGQLLFCYLNYHIDNKKDETLQHISNSKLDVVNNHLFAYMAANLSINNKQTETGKNIINNRNKAAAYMQTPIWDMQMGYAQLHKLELSDAIISFEKYLAVFKGNFYVKDVYQKLSWAYYLQGNTSAAQKARATILTKGGTDSEADKQALKEAKENKWHNVLLLRSRLLSDGGYNVEVLKLLAGKTVESFVKPEEKLEFVYRLARIYDDMHNDAEAIKHYNQAIDLGKDRTEYYAARAALQTGMIYEKIGNKIEAIRYYNICLDMDHHDYKNSLDQKAKSGIARCKGE
ncbi:MAG: tetratricopeptide repeat protein [Chitinophagaceae bacterium]